MRGPDCDWCGADEDDMDVYTVSDGDEFICPDCNGNLMDAAADLLHAVEMAVRALNVKPRFKVGDTDSYAIAAKCDAAIAKAKGST